MEEYWFLAPMSRLAISSASLNIFFWNPPRQSSRCTSQATKVDRWRKLLRVRSIHVQYTETESTCLKHLMIRLDLHVTSRLDSYRARVLQIDFWHDESTTGETIRVDSIELTRIDNIFNPPSKSRSTAWNRVHESISGLSNRKYQRRIDSSWVHWTTLEM